jgi:hypothetical protein
LKDAAHFFIETDALWPTKKHRRYSPEKLQNGLKNLEEALQRIGYEDPGVIATNLVVHTNSGAVTLDVFVATGPQSIVRSIEKVVESSDTNQAPNVQIVQTNVIFSRMWEQDFAQVLRREQYRDGRADVRVEITQLSRELHAGTNYLDIVAEFSRVQFFMSERSNSTGKRSLGIDDAAAGEHCRRRFVGPGQSGSGKVQAGSVGYFRFGRFALRQG